MGIVDKIKSNQRLKGAVYGMIVKNARPRWWIRWFVSPFIHHRAKGSVIRWRTRIDVLPFNKFSLGKNSTIEDFCTINNGVGDVLIGDNSRVGMSNVLIGPVSIGNHVILAQNIVISGLNHTYTDISLPTRLQKVTTAQIVIQDEVWVGANAVITSGVTIGKHAVIAGGAVVTKDIPPYCVAVGNPARVIKRYNFDTQQWEKVSNHGA